MMVVVMLLVMVLVMMVVVMRMTMMRYHVYTFKCQLADVCHDDSENVQ